jgi:probable F420-dependent oxidoreductase
VTAAILELGRVGIWTRQLDGVPGGAAQEAASMLESLGFRTVWIPEAVRREAISHATLLLAGTSNLVVATGIARVHARAPQAAALAQVLLNERFPGRFLLGLGVSHPIVVERMMGQVYGRPLAVMTQYLDAMDATLATVAPLAAPPRVLAALGPKMLTMAAERSGGAHTYLAPAEHTVWARAQLGPDALLAPAIKVVLDTDAGRARAIGRWSLGPSTRTPAYRSNLLRFGFTEADVADAPSDRLVDALVAWGDVDAVERRVREHLDAGASHVCVEVLTGDDTTVPMDAWRRLAPVLAEIN